MHRIGIVGLGHWGPYLARSFELTGRAEIAWLCDEDEAKIDRLESRYRGPRHTANIDDVLADDSVTAVALATPAASHYDLTRRSLEAGKHVLVEKPLTTDSVSGRKLLELADVTSRTLMVGHVFEYNTTVLALRDLVQSGELGEVYYLNFERTNLGPVRTDVDALWDLGTHDIGMNHPLEEECNHFLDCVENGSAPRTDARHGLKVVSVLEAATKSMQNEGSTVPVIYDSTLSLVSSGAS